jgi:hypothetical protein
MRDSAGIWLDYKFFRVLRRVLRFLFPHAGHVRESRPTLQGPLHRIQLLGRADCQNFDSAVKEIPRVTSDVQLLRFALRKNAESYSLHDSRDEIAPSLFLVAHKPQNCSRDRTGSAETETPLAIRVELASWMA